MARTVASDSFQSVLFVPDIQKMVPAINNDLNYMFAFKRLLQFM